MRANVQKWGNSLALRIPKPLADQAHITQGSLVEIKIVDNVLQIEPVAPQKYMLAALLEAVTEENLHEEVDTGEAQGKEIW
jgi:antitoxin MazE